MDFIKNAVINQLGAKTAETHEEQAELITKEFPQKGMFASIASHPATIVVESMIVSQSVNVALAGPIVDAATNGTGILVAGLGLLTWSFALALGVGGLASAAAVTGIVIHHSFANPPKPQYGYEYVVR